MDKNKTLNFILRSNRRKVPMAGGSISLTSTLTEEIITDILIRLPVKSLTRFRSVSKEWLNFMKTPKFIADHLRFSAQTNHCLILDRFYWNNCVCGQDFYLLLIQKNMLQKLPVPMVSESDMGAKIVGSCNGLVCVSHYSLDSASTISVWNPATRQIRRIPEPEIIFLPRKFPPYCLLGFCFNADHNAYEIVRIHCFEDGDSICWVNFISKIHVLRVEKFSLGTGLWTQVQYSNFKAVYPKYDRQVPVYGTLLWTENCVVVHGILFWVATEVSEWFNLEWIVSFDSSREILRKIAMPLDFNNYPQVHKKLAVCNESIAMLICSETERLEYCMDVWVLDHSTNDGLELWRKMQRVGFFSRLERPIGIWKDELVMATGEVIHGVGGFKAELPAVGGAEYSFNALDYEESLVPCSWP
ncbi:hypothetical protein L6164_035438 [Bauhinia variegata]|uniref:Uncharacterized protein n=1 Tax=Bauhinia variegata TaxID=167791 RepID=A0ACB9KDY9_BAUVA|nr:hypothetical protein L6164_035438 [Bauhinia variegata]